MKILTIIFGFCAIHVRYKEYIVYRKNVKVPWDYGGVMLSYDQ